MREIGGYIEFEKNRGIMRYHDGIKLNCGRSALEYIIKVKNIKKLFMPKYLCDSCNDVLKRNNVDVEYYNIGQDFKPNVSNTKEWIYIVNYFGQISNEYIKQLSYVNNTI